MTRVELEGRRSPGGTGQLLYPVSYRSAAECETELMCVMLSNLRPTIAEGPAGFPTKIATALKQHQGLRRCGHVTTGTA